MLRRTKDVGPTVGLPSLRHFVWFFNVPVQVPTQGHPFNGYSAKPDPPIALWDSIKKLRMIQHYDRTNYHISNKTCLHSAIIMYVKITLKLTEN